jgi:hypothetical protein
MASFIMSVVNGIKNHGETSYSGTGVRVGATILIAMFSIDFVIYNDFQSTQNLQ